MVEVVDSSIIHLIHGKNFCKCHNVPPPGTTIKIKKNFLSYGKSSKSKNKMLFYSTNILGPTSCQAFC
jgi:hypothetical protein